MVSSPSLKLHPCIILILCLNKGWILPTRLIYKIFFWVILIVLNVSKYQTRVFPCRILFRWFLPDCLLKHQLLSLLLSSLYLIIIYYLSYFKSSWIPIILCHCSKLYLLWIFLRGCLFFNVLNLVWECIKIQLATSRSWSSLCWINFIKLVNSWRQVWVIFNNASSSRCP